MNSTCCLCLIKQIKNSYIVYIFKQILYVHMMQGNDIIFPYSVLLWLKGFSYYTVSSYVLRYLTLFYIVNVYDWKALDYFIKVFHLSKEFGPLSWIVQLFREFHNWIHVCVSLKQPNWPIYLFCVFLWLEIFYFLILYISLPERSWPNYIILFYGKT